jgi:cytochrome c biogenesis protein ResB
LAQQAARRPQEAFVAWSHMKTQQHGKTMTGACLVALALLAAASAVGAVLGGERATALFNSAPLAAFWTLVAASLVAGLAFYRRVAGRPGFLGMHLGVLLVLLGAMYGSDAGHVFASRVFSSRKVPSGYLIIREGASTSTILSRPRFEEIGILPFSIRLNDFNVEYYDTPGVRVDFMIDVPGPVRDYTSDVSVVEQGAEVARKAIEVNHPLHYGGYHFYQHSYDSENEAYTILSVTSDSGLSVVYGGFILLCLGSFYGCWVQPALDAAKRRKRDGG